MSEVYYDINILIKDESTALELSENLKREEEACGYELITLIKTVLKTSIDSHGFEYNIDSLKSFKNEIQINCYSGRSEPPLGIVSALAKIEGSIIKISESYEDAPKPLVKYFLDGNKSTKKDYEKSYKKNKIEDETDKLQRYLSNFNFRNADEIADRCELNRIDPEDDYLFELIQSHNYISLAKKLLKAGLFNNGDSVYKSPWIGNVAQYGSTDLLVSFIEHGLDPYDSGEGQETALHSCLYSSEQYSLSNIKYLIECCSENLDITTEYGSPLWFGFEEMTNIPGCLLFEAADAKVIPPLGFYDSKETVEILVESIKHRDADTFKRYYTNEHYHLSLYWALRHQSYQIVIWLNNEKTIDWHSLISKKLELNNSLDQYFLEKPLYEIPFSLSDGGGCDSRLLDHIIENIKPIAETYNQLAVYISGLKYLPESVQLLRKLKNLGAVFEVSLPINNDEDESSLYRALQNECIENLEYLLEIGATIPNRDELGIESIGEYIEDYFEGEIKIRATALLEKYALVS